MISLPLIISLVTVLNAQAVQTKPLTDHQIVTLTILAESRGEGPRGMLAVSNVIAARIKQRHKTAKQICLEPRQYSCWNSGSIPLSLLKCKEAPYASRLALALVKGDWLPDVTGNANHYARYDCHPKWAKEKYVTVRIKNHVFYKIHT